MLCCIPNCSSKHSANNKISFHTFPKNLIMNRKWRNAIKVSGLNIAFPRICSLHFNREDYISSNSRMLKDDAVPSLRLPETFTNFDRSRHRKGQRLNHIKHNAKPIRKFLKVNNDTHELQTLSEKFYVKMEIPILPPDDMMENQILDKYNYEEEVPILNIKVEPCVVENNFKTVKCICNVNLELENIRLILCSICGTSQHRVCMGFFDEEDIINEPYTCYSCNYKNFTKSASKAALMRLAIVISNYTNEVPNDLFDVLPPSIRMCLIQDLKSEEILYEKDNLYFLNKESLDNEKIKKILQESVRQHLFI